MALHLGSKDFTVRGSLLNVSTRTGNVLVFFKKNSCPHCAAFENTFLDCARSEPGIEWAIVDLDRHPEVIQKSRQTRNPIKGVPFVVMFVNGVMKAIHTNRDRSRQAVLAFVNEIMGISGINFQQVPQMQIQQTPQSSFMQHAQQQRQAQSTGYRSVAPPPRDEETTRFSSEFVPYNIPWASSEKTN
nr:thioredoxin [Marseillevirus cajuinensis]